MNTRQHTTHPADIAGAIQRWLGTVAPSGEQARGAQRLLLVAGVCFAAFALGLMLVLLLGDDARPLMLMVLAVVVVTAYGGLQAGLLASLLSLALSSLLLLDESWAPAGERLVINLFVFAVAAFVVASVVDALRSARNVAAERQRLLDEMSRVDSGRQSALAKLERVLGIAPVGIAICDDRDCHLLEINDEFARILGIPGGNIGSRSAPEAERPSGFRFRERGADVPADGLPLQTAIRTGRAVEGRELEVVREDGVNLRVLIDAAPLRGDDGRVRGAVAAMADVTAQRKMQETLARSEERLRIAIGALPMFVFEQDHRLRYTWVTALGPGFALEQILGATDDALFPAPDAQRIMAIKRRALESGERVREEVTVDYGGDTRTFDLTIEPYADTIDGAAAGGIVGAAFDVTERKLLEEALREANKAKDEFVGHISHEMRTPLTMIRGNAELLERRSASLDEAARNSALTDIRESAERLDRIIEDLLVLARLQDGQAIERDEIRLQDVVRESIEDQRRQSPHHRIEHVVEGEPARVYASASALRQVLGNLLSNAHKYSPEERPIEVRTREDDGWVTVSVRDYGRGFAADEAERLFAPFYRSPSTVPTSGHGIGLSVCRRLVEAHDGKIWARLAEGGGAEFVVALPAGA